MTFRQMLDVATEAKPLQVIHTRSNRLWFAYHDSVACVSDGEFVLKATVRGTPHIMPFATIASEFAYALIDS